MDSSDLINYPLLIREGNKHEYVLNVDEAEVLQSHA